MNHPAIGKHIEIEGVGSGKITAARRGPMFLDGKKMVGQAKMMASVEFLVQPDNGDPSVWVGPFRDMQQEGGAA